MAFTRFYRPVEEDGSRWPDIPDGWHIRARFHAKRTLRGRHRLPYSLSTHDKATQVGPIPLPFRHRRRRR